MTGEMAWIRPDGTDANGEVWETHAAVSQAIGGELHPFDVYQGPYIVIGEDISVGEVPYRIPLRGLGVIRLWLTSSDGVHGRVYREDTEEESEVFWCMDTEGAVRAAQELLQRKERA